MLLSYAVPKDLGDAGPVLRIGPAQLVPKCVGGGGEGTWVNGLVDRRQRK